MRQEELLTLVRNLRTAVPEIQGVMLASQDGLPIVHDFPETEAPRIAAMAATSLGLGKRIAATLRLGDFQEAVVRGASGYLVVYDVGDKAVLALSAPASANLGLVHLEARETAQKIKGLL
jgi:predicted regulator of Ras-like GTPase activity (Roadblock/LC7/MglB family)